MTTKLVDGRYVVIPEVAVSKEKIVTIARGRSLVPVYFTLKNSVNHSNAKSGCFR